MSACLICMYSTLPHDRKLFTVCYTVLWFGLLKCDQQVSDLQVSDLQVRDLLCVPSRLTSSTYVYVGVHVVCTCEYRISMV